MTNLYKICILIPLTLIITGCTPKLTVKSLHPSKIPNEKIYSIKVDDFLDDDINQANKIKEKIANKIIDNNKIFLLTNNENSDAIIDGEILESSLFYDIYYKRYIDYNRCRYYRYNEKTKSKTCIEHHYRLKPCERRDYTVRTKIKLLKPSVQKVLFQKTYSKSRSIDKCYDHYYYPYDSFSRYKRDINSQLASQIADEILDDISPHYVYYDLEIIDSLDDKNLTFTKEQEKRFEKAAELIEEKHFDFAKKELINLDIELKNKSWEVLYNLGLISENQQNLFDANNYYKSAKQNIKELDDLALVKQAILRTKINLEEKIKAKSQLP